MGTYQETFTMPDNPHLGDRVLHRMKSMGYKSMAQLSRQVDCTPATISHIIKTGRCHDSHRLKLLAWHLATTTDWLLGRTPGQKVKIAICGKSFCGENARWAVRRHGQHHTMAERCCDNHVIHFISRDFMSQVYPLEQFIREFASNAEVEEVVVALA